MRIAAALWAVGFLCCVPFALAKLESLERDHALKGGGADSLGAGGVAGFARSARDAMEPIRFIQRKARLDKLNALLTPWYEEMRARRAALAGAPPETIDAFNSEAAAYKELLQFTAVEAQAITAWESQTSGDEAAAVEGTEEG